MDKIDAYDKEQLQAMGWLFDETQASDSGTLLVGEYMAVTPISKGQLVVCRRNAKVAYVFSADSGAFAFDQAVFAVAQSDAAENEPVDVMMYGGTFEATGVTGSGVELYAICHMEQDVYTESSVLYFDYLTFDQPETLPDYPRGTVAVALGNKQGMDDTGTTVTMYNQSKYFYVMNAFDETYLVDLANPVNVYWIGQVLGASVEFGTAMGGNKGLQDALSSSSDFGTKLAASVAFINALINNSTFQTGLASKDTFGTQLGVNTGLAPVRTVKQTLTNKQKQTAWGNIGLNVYIIDQSKFGTALTDAELAAYNAAEAILVTNHQKYVSALYLLASNSGSNAMFYSIVDSSTFMRIRIDDPNTILNETSVLSDQNAIKFNVNQSLSLAQSNRAIGNVGTGFYIVPYGGTVPAEDLERAVGASALILTNTPSGSMPKIYLRGRVNAEGNIYFYSFTDTYTTMSVILNPTTGAVSPVTVNSVTAGLLSYSSVQNLSINDTNRVMSNIGLRYVVIQVTNGTATLTNAQQNAMLSARGVLIEGSTSYEPATRRVYALGQTDGNIVSGYSLLSGSLLLTLSYNKTTKVLTVNTGAQPLLDQGAVRFNTVQELNETQQAQARENIGITQGLLNDADFIAELKTKLGLT